MTAPRYDLWYDATAVDRELVVETWISHGPKADGPAFDPQPEQWVLVGDDDEPACRAQVIRRDGDRVWVQLDLGLVAQAPSGAVSERH